MYGIDAAIVVEEDAEVVDAAFHVVVLPGTFNILAGIALKPLAVNVRKDVELPIGVTDARRPDALTVYFLVVSEGESIVVEVEAREAVTYVLPVDEVLGVQDNKPGNGVHSSPGKVVVLANANDIGVGKLVVKERVGVGAVPVVGSP